jgi:hypothetical protein
MAGHRVDRLVLSRVPLGGAYVDQGGRVWPPEPCSDLGRIQLWPLAGVSDKVAPRWRPTGAGNGRQPGGPPGGKAAVEDSDVSMSGISQQPPEARRGLGGCGIVGDNQGILAYADLPHRPLEDADRGKWVTAADAGRSGELRLEIHPDCARNVARFEVRLSRRSAESPAHIGDHRRSD